MDAKHDTETAIARDVDSDKALPGYLPATEAGASLQEDQAYVYGDDQKLGYTATVFVILNKMIGTGSKYTTLIDETY